MPLQDPGTPAHTALERLPAQSTNNNQNSSTRSQSRHRTSKHPIMTVNTPSLACHFKIASTSSLSTSIINGIPLISAAS